MFNLTGEKIVTFLRENRKVVTVAALVAATTCAGLLELRSWHGRKKE